MDEITFQTVFNEPHHSVKIMNKKYGNGAGYLTMANNNLYLFLVDSNGEINTMTVKDKTIYHIFKVVVQSTTSGYKLTRIDPHSVIKSLDERLKDYNLCTSIMNVVSRLEDFEKEMKYRTFHYQSNHYNCERTWVLKIAYDIHHTDDEIAWLPTRLWIYAYNFSNSANNCRIEVELNFPDGDIDFTDKNVILEALSMYKISSFHIRQKELLKENVDMRLLSDIADAIISLYDELANGEDFANMRRTSKGIKETRDEPGEPAQYEFSCRNCGTSLDLSDADYNNICRCPNCLHKMKIIEPAYNYDREYDF